MAVKVHAADGSDMNVNMVKDFGEDSGAKYPEVLAFVVIATMDRSKSTVATQEETLTL